MKQKTVSSTERICQIAGALIALVIFETWGIRWFATPPSAGFNFDRMFFAGVAGAVGVAIGTFVGKAIGK